MNISQIESNLNKLMSPFNKKDFIYDLLLAYGLPKNSITRLKKGNRNLSKEAGEISWKKKVFFKEEFDRDLHVTISELSNTIKHDERFVIVTDFKLFLAIDTITGDKLDIDLKDLPKHYDFFLPWAGMEKAQHANENPADVKAAEKMAKLFDEIKKDNPDDSPEFVHGLNVFLSRLLFCFFAEDTNIFKDGQFTNAINSHTQLDGSDLHQYLDKLFEVLDTPNSQRSNLAAYIEEFPYVNGALFRQRLIMPIFTRRSRQAIIDSGELNWSAINPDIFGSMIQAVITPEQRGGLGMHYTSVPNIMKVIEPLFLDDLKEAHKKAKGNSKRTNELLHRIRKIKIFDPACGSGNFLIIAYKELRRLEMQIFKESGLMALSGITLDQFYGIELDDFAHEIAQLSLWLAEHQMNTEFFMEFGRTNPTLPLKEAGQITHGNASRINWESVCPKRKGEEIYILGNPPYLGAHLQDSSQKADIEFVNPVLKRLDYISIWFLKSSVYISDSSKCYSAFVTTNSISQGEQVGILWPLIFKNNVQINFCVPNFKWSNSAKSNAAVIVSIIGLSSKIDKKKKFIYKESLKKEVFCISPYLTANSKSFVIKRNNPLSNFTKLTRGNEANDNGNFLINQNEYDELIEKNKTLSPFIKKTMGSYEFLNNVNQYTFWLVGLNEEMINDIPEIKNRIELVREFRLKSKKEATRKAANYHWLYTGIRHKESDSILIPRVSSQRRDYIPFGFLSSRIIVKDSAYAMYDAIPSDFGILSSKMHMVWVSAVAGRLKSDYRYSSNLCWNTFPFPKTSNQRQQEIDQTVFRILEEREKNSELTLSQLYDPDKMPDGLREAHHQNDLAIERCYRSKPFESDEERLEYLFKLYEQMIDNEKNIGSLFEQKKKTRKRR